MNSGDFDRIIALFEAACRLHPAERGDFLVRECGSDLDLRSRVEELLRHDGNPGGPGAAVTAGGGAQLLARQIASEPTLGSSDGQVGGQRSMPQTVGRYRVIRELGRGGMGVVYEAEQDHPRRRVALKMLAPWLSSRELIRRFEHECQILGRLKHPGIAQIFDAGSADLGNGPQPFFAMEFVQGEPLSAFAARRNLSARHKIALLERICRAVEHAHRKGVIHRDLKPANILVAAESDSNDSTSGAQQPKILDFGIARATDADLQMTTVQTDVGQLLGTLPYMSPEQLSGDSTAIDTRSDVYALGVIAFELLAGRLPHDVRKKALPEAARVIREEDAPRLSTIARVLGADLDAIIGKSLDKDPSRRYQSAANLADDLRRYLSGEPIQARAPSAAYQLRKLIGRHKLASAIAALFFASVSGFGIWMSVLYARAGANLQRAVQAERAASTEAETARKATAFLVNLFQVSNPAEARGSTITAREILDAGAERIEKELAGQPVVQAALMHSIGLVYGNLGLYEPAGALLQKALSLRRQAFGPQSVEFAESAAAVASWFEQTGRLAEAETLFRDALGLYRASLPESDVRISHLKSELGAVLMHRSNHAEAEVLIREALAAFKAAAAGKPDADVANLLNNLATLLADLGRRDEALKHYREAEAMQREVLPENHPLRAVVLTNLAKLLEDQGDYAGARDRRAEALRIARVVYGHDSPMIANELDGLGQLNWHLGDYDAAEACFREALEKYRHSLGPDNPKYAFCLNNLGALLLRKGDYQAAKEYYREALPLVRRSAGEESTDAAMAMNNLGAVLWEAGNLDEAEAMLRGTLRVRQKLYSGDNPSVATTMSNLAGVLCDKHQLAEAEQLARDSLQMRRNIRKDHPDFGEGLNRLAQILLAQGRTDEAIALFQESQAVLCKAAGPQHPYVGYPLFGHGEALLRQAQPAQAEPLLRETLQIWSKTLPPEHRDVIYVQSLLGECLTGLGRLDEAEPMLLQACAGLEKVPAITPERRRRILDRAATLYDARGAPQQAARYRQMAATGPDPPR